MRTAKVFGIGADGRKQYTKDPDARAGHRSSTGQRLAGPYVGYELHLGVQAREVRWTNYVDRTSLGEDVPNVITTLNLVPAGSHRARSIVDDLIESSRRFRVISEVIWDPGYSLCQPDTTTFRLGPNHIEQTMQLTTHQRGIRPFSGDGLLLDGQLYSKLLPAELRDLTMPPRGAPGASRRVFEEKFNQRAHWRYVRHSAPDEDGATRWKCPFCARLLRTRRIRKTMRGTRHSPLVLLPEGVTTCCSGTFTAPAVELPLAQRIPFGTTAWRISMERRQVVESANAALKGGFVDIARGFFRVFGRVKMSVILGFTAAGYNLDRVRAFRARQAAQAAAGRHYPKRRLGTWHAATQPTRSPEPSATGPPD